MTEQVIIKMDSRLKRAAQKQAKDQGTTLSSVLRFATMRYISGQTKVGLMDLSWVPVETEELNEKTKRELRIAQRETRMGIGLSPVFSDVESAKNYFKNLSKKVSR